MLIDFNENGLTHWDVGSADKCGNLVKNTESSRPHENPSRLSQAERFLKDGDKVKATIMFRGREIQHSDLAEVLLKRMAEDLKEIAEVHQWPKKEGRNMMMMMAPRK